MTDDEPHDECEATPEELAEWERKNEAWREHIREKVDAGWTWDEDRLTLTHSNREDWWIMFDPLTLEETYSVKYLEAVKEEMDRTRRSGEL